MASEAANKKTALTNEEEAMLASQAVLGNSRALDRLVSSNLGFVINLAKEYQGQGVDFDDLVSEGSIALINCIMKWNPEKTPSLVLYAVHDIRKAMQHAIDKEATIVRIPEGEGANIRSIDAPLRVGHTRSLGETMPQKNQRDVSIEADLSFASAELIENISGLTAREREVIICYYGIERPHLTMAEIGEMLGLKRERIRQIRKKAERKLRKPLRSIKK